MRKPLTNYSKRSHYGIKWYNSINIYDTERHWTFPATQGKREKKKNPKRRKKSRVCMYTLNMYNHSGVVAEGTNPTHRTIRGRATSYPPHTKTPTVRSLETQRRAGGRLTHSCGLGQHTSYIYNLDGIWWLMIVSGQGRVREGIHDGYIYFSSFTYCIG